MSKTIFVSEERTKKLKKIFQHEGLNGCIEETLNDDEIFLCRTLELDRLVNKIEYLTTVKEGYIYDDIKEMQRILKDMPIINR